MPAPAAEYPPGYRVIDPSDPFETGSGPFFVPVDQAAPFRLLLRVEKRHCNSSGSVHGGLLATMADVAVCAIAVLGQPGERAITVSLTTDFVSAGNLGDLIEARAEVTRRTGSLVFARAQIEVEDRVLLTCSAIIKRAKRS